MNRELVRRLDELLEFVCQAEGWRREQGKNRHHKIIGPDGQLVICSTTPSDWRTLENIRQNLRRAGATLPPKRDLPKGKR